MVIDSLFVKSFIAFSHPILMAGILASSLYTLYLGIQVRRARTTEDIDLRKELVKGKYNQKHFKLGSILLALWVLGGLGGMASTYILYSKLFVGPHLLVGLSAVGLVALAASLAPYLQKGKNSARVAHIILTTSLLGLTLAQTFTGLKIVQNVIGDVFGSA